MLSAPDAKKLKLWEAFWKIVYDDDGIEQQHRLEIIALIKAYRHHRHIDTRSSPIFGNNVADEIEHIDEETDLNPEHGILST